MSLISLGEAQTLREGKKLVLTNGVFDILHAGHVDNLKRARALGDMLIVAINTDASAKRLGKGPNRPVNALADRAAVLEAVRHVDCVVAFDEDTPIAVIEALKPEVYVKGGDYRIEDLPETVTVRAYGGEVVILSLLPGRSTTGIVERFKD